MDLGRSWFALVTRRCVQVQMNAIGELRQALADSQASLAEKVAEVSSISAERDAVQLEVQEVHSRAEAAEAELNIFQDRLAGAEQAILEGKAEERARKTVMDAHERKFRKLQQELERIKGQVCVRRGA